MDLLLKYDLPTLALVLTLIIVVVRSRLVFSFLGLCLPQKISLFKA